MILAEALRQARQQLQDISPTAALDAQVLLADILDRSRTWVLAHPEASLSPEQSRRFQAALRRLMAGEPLPYVIGHWEFYGLDLRLTPAVLIPRPETELLVEHALGRLGPEPALIADVGTGSGCIAVALAVHRPQIRVVATDCSAAALAVARHNARRHGVADRFWPVQTDLLRGLRGPFHLIVANLPYIPTATWQHLAVARHEPRLALDGGADGLRLIARLLRQAPARLRPGGVLLLEIEYRQGEAVPALARAAFPEAEIRVYPDGQGHPRVVLVQL